MAAFDELHRAPEILVVDTGNALLVERPGVLNGLAPDASEARIDAGVVLVRRQAVDHAARPVFVEEGLVVARVVRVLHLGVCVQVVEVAVEFVEAVRGRQELVAVAQVVLAELAGAVAQRLEHLRDRRVLVRKSLRRADQPDFRQANAHGVLAGDEPGASRGATLFAVVVGEDRALLGDAVDVGRTVTHLPASSTSPPVPLSPPPMYLLQATATGTQTTACAEATGALWCGSMERNATRLNQTTLHFERSEGGVKPLFLLCSGCASRSG